LREIEIRQTTQLRQTVDTLTGRIEWSRRPTLCRIETVTDALKIRITLSVAQFLTLPAAAYDSGVSSGRRSDTLQQVRVAVVYSGIVRLLILGALSTREQETQRLSGERHNVLHYVASCCKELHCVAHSCIMLQSMQHVP
jgi:hypothetical protein